MALGTLVVLVRRVRLHVCSQIRAIGERLAAVGASVGLLASVAAQVALQEPGPREHLATHAATVRKLVREHVHRQGGHADVRLAAVDALLGRLRVDAAMRLLVPRQIRRGRVLLATLAAHVTTDLGSLGYLDRFGFLILLHGGRPLVLRSTVRDEQCVIRVTGWFHSFRLFRDSLYLLVSLRRLRVRVTVLDIAAAFGGRRR